MAAYATYRHIEIDNIGFGKKRVLKPPGGGSSDIFGSPEPPASHSLRKTRTFDQQTSGTVMNGTKSPTDSTPSSTTSSTDGNPVTGDGYEPAPVKDARSNSTTSTGTADFKPRTRVPPGGFSSGLWWFRSCKFLNQWISVLLSTSISHSIKTCSCLANLQLFFYSRFFFVSF